MALFIPALIRRDLGSKIGEFLDPIACLVELVATIEPWRCRATQARQKPFSSIFKCDRRVRGFFSSVFPYSRRYSAKLLKRSSLPACTISVSDGAPSAKITSCRVSFTCRVGRSSFGVHARRRRRH
jgi:hypothetical protein